MSEPPATEGATSQELVAHADRLADRLRVVGPRLAARDGAQAAAMLDDVRGVLQALADLGADAEGRPRRPVPVLAAPALGDQVLVLAHDVAAAGDPAARTDAVQLIRDLARRV